MTRFLRIFAWFCLLAILAVTLSPIQFRPSVANSANLERFLAFFVVGAAFSLAYPRQWLTVIILTVGSAGLFELLQKLAPGRHGEFIDFVVKSLGALTGVLSAHAARTIGLFRDKTNAE